MGEIQIFIHFSSYGILRYIFRDLRAATFISLIHYANPQHAKVFSNKDNYRVLFHVFLHICDFIIRFYHRIRIAFKINSNKDHCYLYSGSSVRSKHCRAALFSTCDISAYNGHTVQQPIHICFVSGWNNNCISRSKIIFFTHTLHASFEMMIFHV